jgi:hypothetical protein
MIRVIEQVAIGTEVFDDSVENIVWDQSEGYLTIELDPNAELIAALQKNVCMVVQTSEGTYRAKYFCSFRNLAPECASSVRRVTLGMKNVSFHRGTYLAVME